MRIELDTELQELQVDGVRISLEALLTLANPDSRLLYRLVRDGEVVRVRQLNEAQVIWLNERERYNEGE